MKYQTRHDAVQAVASRKKYLGGLALVWILMSVASAHAAQPDAAKPDLAKPDAGKADDEPADAAKPAAEPAPPPQAAAVPEKTPLPDGPAPTAFTPLQIESGNATIKLGLLAQPTLDVYGTGDPASAGGTSVNMYLRRIRLMFGGTLFKKFEYFVATDSPNLFKVSDTGLKAKQMMGIQDAIVTYKAYEDYFKIDAGYMLPPGAHNALQGAGTLYSLGYFNNSFRYEGLFNSAGQFNAYGDVGRDAGVQIRGLMAGGHIEYRVGMFEGVRQLQPDPGDKIQGYNMFRVAGRVQINVLDPEPGFFYAGTYLGQKQILSFGASYDFQAEYKHWALDAFLDTPAGPGSVTLQVNVAKWDGGPFIPGLHKQTAYMGEAGYRIDALNLSPIVHFEYRQGGQPPQVTTHETHYGGGLAYWPYGHNVNVKAFYTRLQPRGAVTADKTYNEFQLQWQLYFY
jgi:Phosphate-selective porin O and P